MASHIQIQINEPCHQEWNWMVPAIKGRYCDSCRKQVMDFTSMSDHELVEYFKKPSTGTTCGRFTRDQLSKDLEIPRKRIPWVRYFFQILLPAFLSTAKATAQGKIIIKEEKVCALDQPLPLRDTPLNNHFQQISKSIVLGGISIIHPERSKWSVSGSVNDENGFPLAGASVMIKGTPQGVATDKEGQFKLKIRNRGEATLVISYIGYEKKEMEVSYSDTKVSISLEPFKGVLMGEVYISSGRKKSRPKTDTPLIQQPMMDTAFKMFKVYPNPVAPGADCNIEWEQAKEGYYMLQLFSQSGQTVYQRELWIDRGAKLLTVKIPVVPVGTYFLRITDKDSGKTFSEKIIIQ